MSLEQTSTSSSIHILSISPAPSSTSQAPSASQQSAKPGYYDAANPHGVPLETDNAVPAIVAKPLNAADHANHEAASKIGPGTAHANKNEPEKVVTGGNDYEGN